MKEIFSSFVHNILGLENRSEKIHNDLTDDVMNIILKLRTQAKTQKDWATADLIRDELNKLDIEIRDSSEGSKWEIKNNQ